jgi:hypothetical protein
MATGFLRRPIPIVAGAGWAETFNFWSGPQSARAPVDLTGYAAEVTLLLANVPGATPIVLSTAAGSIVITVNAVSLSVPRTTTVGWALGDYDFVLRIWNPAETIDAYVVLSNAADSRAKVIQGQAA